MTRFFLAAFFLLPAAASAQTERAADVRASGAPASAPVVSAAPSPLSVSVPTLSAAPLAAAPLAVAPLAVAPLAAPAPAAAAAVVPLGSVAAEKKAPSARGELDRGARLTAAAPESDSGRVLFDDGAAQRAPGATFAAAASDGPRLDRPSASPASAPAPRIPLGQRVTETAELGGMAVVFHLLTGVALLILGAHASFPVLAGALWALAGSEMIKQLGKLRSVVVGGWQASHDQKMRHDYGTGKLVDIRGRKYGEDRYDQLAPGPVSARERYAAGAVAVAMGLPWVIPSGLAAVALYAGGASAAFALRAAWRRRHPEAAAVAERPNFEYDR